MTTPKEDRWSEVCKQQILTLLENSNSFNDVDVFSNVESFVFEMIDERDNTPEDISEILSYISARVGPDAFNLLTDVLTKVTTYIHELNTRAAAITITMPTPVGHSVTQTIPEDNSRSEPDVDEVPTRFQKKWCQLRPRSRVLPPEIKRLCCMEWQCSFRGLGVLCLWRVYHYRDQNYPEKWWECQRLFLTQKQQSLCPMFLLPVEWINLCQKSQISPWQSIVWPGRVSNK